MRLPRPVALLLLVAMDLFATRHAFLFPVERMALVGVSAAVLGAAALLAGRLGARRIPWAVGLLAALVLLWLPLRWLPGARLLLALGACVAAAPELPVRRTFALFVVAVLAGGALLRLSANLRFVAFEQAPLSGALLDGIARLAPAPARATARPPTPGEPAEILPALGDAHIVLITVDALRADRLGRRTPNLDALAARGLRFERAYAQVPSTAWSVSALMTGAPPDRLGASPPALAETLRAQRWRTFGFYPAGLFFDGRGDGRGPLDRYARTRFGFDWTDTRTLDAPALTDAVLARLEQLRADGEPRALMWVHYFDVHEPYVEHPGLTEGTSAEARYDGEVAFVDRELGRLLDGLGRLRRPVIVCLTADHGEELGEHGGAYHGSSLYEEQVRVPLIIAAPGLAPRVVSDPVELTDVAPALLALAGVGASPPTFGHDAHAQVGTRRMLVRGRWKLIHDLQRDVDELYDLTADPREQHNRFDQRRAEAAPLHAALDAWFALSPPDALERTLADRRAPPDRRAAAARELGELLAFASRPALRAALRDGDPAVRAESALALGRMTDRPATEPLIGLLAQPEYRHRAALALGRLRDPRAVPALVESLSDVSPSVRREAAHYLGWLGGAAEVSALEAATGDVRVRSEAYLALGRLAGRTHDPAVARFLSARLDAEPHADARESLTRALALSSPSSGP